MGITRKLFITGGLLICLVLMGQGLFFKAVVENRLKKNVIEQLSQLTQSKIDILSDTLLETEKDMSVILSLKAFDDYFTSRFFEDRNGMTEAVSDIEPFLKKVVLAKTQYTKAQIQPIHSPPILQITQGGRVEKYDRFDSARILDRFRSRGVAAGGDDPPHMVFHETLKENEDDGRVILSASPLIFEETVEGVLWLYQPIGRLLNTIFAELAAGDVNGVITDQKGNVVSRSMSLDEDTAAGLASGSVSGWVRIVDAVPGYNWTLILGMKERVAFAGVNRIFNIGISLMLAYLTLSAVALYFMGRSIDKPLLRELENKVSERTAALEKTLRDLTDTQEKLIRSEREALAASKAKSAFLANMSHEIRTPMNGITGMLELLLDTEMAPKQYEYAVCIQRSADALLVIINDILDFSRVEAGKMKLDPIPCNLQDLVEDIGHLFSARADHKGLQVIVRYDPEAPKRAVGDAGRIRQVLANLVGNAVKFTRKGHVLIDVRAKDKDGENAEFLFSVKDTGIGISAEKLDRIFDKFTQADGSTTRKYGGAGLGLAISKRLVELMEGEIGVRSEPGGGSDFFFSIDLPLDNSRVVEKPPAADLTRLRILVVDDNETNRVIYTELMNSWGIESRSAASGPKALDRLRTGEREQKPFHIALVDYHMPGMDGDQFAETVKAEPLINNTVLIKLSSGIDGHAADRSGEPLFAASLEKPVRRSLLLETLSAAWANHEQSGLHGDLNAPDHPAPTARSRDEAPPVYPKIHARVLLVEDNPINQEVSRAGLQFFGCRVDLAADGREAVEMIKHTAYDLILMDCMMPVMDGYQATRAIRNWELGIEEADDGETGGIESGTCDFPSDTRIPIIALTAGVMPGDREQCMSAGMDDYLSKPIKREALFEVLQKYAETER